MIVTIMRNTIENTINPEKSTVGTFAFFIQTVVLKSSQIRLGGTKIQ